MPPPQTRSSSSSPVGVRATSLASMLASVVTAWLGASDWKRWRVALVFSATVSSSVFHSLHCGQRPSHLGAVPPQAVQV